MCDIKFLILDIDGTIAGHSNQVSQITQEAIRKVQLQGIKVGFATGRMYCLAKRFHQYVQTQIPIIAYNGAWIQDPQTNKVLLHRPVQLKVAQELFSDIEKLQRQGLIEVELYFNDELYVERITQKTHDCIERWGITVRVVNDFNSLFNGNPTKILVASTDTNLTTQILIQLKERYQDKELYLTQSNPFSLEATQVGVDKGAALKYLAEEILNVSPEKIMAIGDSFNDLSMLEYVGVSIAMGDAPPEVKQIVDWVAPDVENHGVAEAIAHFF